jgi:hypothetical protein
MDKGSDLVQVYGRSLECCCMITSKTPRSALLTCWVSSGVQTLWLVHNSFINISEPNLKQCCKVNLWAYFQFRNSVEICCMFWELLATPFSKVQINNDWKEQSECKASDFYGKNAYFECMSGHWPPWWKVFMVFDCLSKLVLG